MPSHPGPPRPPCTGSLGPLSNWAASTTCFCGLGPEAGRHSTVVAVTRAPPRPGRSVSVSPHPRARCQGLCPQACLCPKPPYRSWTSAHPVPVPRHPDHGIPFGVPLRTRHPVSPGPGDARADGLGQCCVTAPTPAAGLRHYPRARLQRQAVTSGSGVRWAAWTHPRRQGTSPVTPSARTLPPSEVTLRGSGVGPESRDAIQPIASRTHGPVSSELPRSPQVHPPAPASPVSPGGRDNAAGGSKGQGESHTESSPGGTRRAFRRRRRSGVPRARSGPLRAERRAGPLWVGEGTVVR